MAAEVRTVRFGRILVPVPSAADVRAAKAAIRGCERIPLDFGYAVMLTPEAAAKLRVLAVHNRDLAPSQVKGFEKKLRGEDPYEDFVLSFDPLAVTVDGFMINCGHRSQAVINTGIPMPVMIAWGVPNDALKIGDQGARRAVPAQVALFDERMRDLTGRERSRVRRALSFLYREEMGAAQGRSGMNTLSTTQAIHFFDEYNGVVDYVDLGLALHKAIRIVPDGMATYVGYRLGLEDPVRAIEFMQGLSSGEALNRNDLRYVASKDLLDASQVLGPKRLGWNFVLAKMLEYGRRYIYKDRKRGRYKWDGQSESFPYVSDRIVSKRSKSVK